LQGNIRVFCRMRPLLPFEIKKGYTECVTFPEEGAVLIKDDKDQILKFEFDQVYSLLWMGITSVYLPMVKLEVARLTR